MTTRQQVLDFGLSLPDTYQDAPFHDENWQLVRIRKNKKVFLWTYERNGHMCINLKVDPEWREFWRNAYSAVLPGYHQNKEHWNTVVLDGTVPQDVIEQMIAESYDLVKMKEPTRRNTENDVKLGKNSYLTQKRKKCKSVCDYLTQKQHKLTQ